MPVPNWSDPDCLPAESPLTTEILPLLSSECALPMNTFPLLELDDPPLVIATVPPPVDSLNPPWRIASPPPTALDDFDVPPTMFTDPTLVESAWALPPSIETSPGFPPSNAPPDIKTLPASAFFDCPERREISPVFSAASPLSKAIEPDSATEETQ